MNNSVKVLLGLALVTVLSGCVSPNQKEEIVITSTPAPRVTLVLPETSRIQTRPVNWRVVTPDNIDVVFEELKNSGDSIVLMALTSKGYENLSLNYSDALTLIREQKAVIYAYEKYYKSE